MKARPPFNRRLLFTVAFFLLTVFALATASSVLGDEWVNYNKAPDIVYDVAIDARSAEQAMNSFRYAVWVATESGVFRIDNQYETFKRYTYADGLSYNFVRSIMVGVEVLRERDKWFGTINGELNQFDNSDWYTYLSPDLTGINHIDEDSNGTLWLGRGDFATALMGLGGLNSFDGTNWTVYNVGNSDLASNYVEAVAIDGSDTLWLGTCPPPLGAFFGQPGGLNLFDGTTWTTYQKADGLANNNVYDIAFDSAGVAWMATLFNGVSSFDGTTWTTYNADNSGLPNNNVQAVAIDGSDNKWFGTCCSGLVLFDGTDWTVYDTATSDIIGDNIHAIDIYETADGSTEIWVGTNNGVSRFQPLTGNWTAFTFDGILYTDYRDVAIDGSDNKWFGTNDGVSMFDGTDWTEYDSATSGLVSDAVAAVAVDSSDMLWCGTDAGLSSFDGTTWTTYTTADSGLVSDNVTAVAVDSSNTLWVGTDAGAGSFDGSDWASYIAADNGLGSDTIRAVAIDSGDTVWFGTDAGLSSFDGTDWTSYATADSGLVSDNVAAIAIDSSDTLWIGTDAGLSRFDGSAWTTYDVASGDLITDTINAVAVDNSDDIWVGTDAGAGRFDGTTWTHFSCGDGIADRNVSSIAAESDDDMWFTTGNGVSSYIKSVVNPATAEPTVDPGPGMSHTGHVGCFIGSLSEFSR